MKKIIYFFLILFLTSCSSINKDLDMNLDNNNTPEPTIDSSAEPEETYDPYDVKIKRDPIECLKAEGYKYGIDDQNNPDKTLLMRTVEMQDHSMGINVNVYDFVELSISNRLYYNLFDGEFYDDSNDAYLISRSNDEYEILSIYDLKSNTAYSSSDGCTYYFDSKTYSPNTEKCKECYEYANNAYRLYELVSMLTNYKINRDEYGIVWNALNNDEELMNSYVKAIIEYFENN